MSVQTEHHRLLIVDTETTGLSFEHSRLIEVAAVLYCTESKTVLGGVQFLVHDGTDNAAEFINKISPAALARRPVPGLEAAFKDMYSDCDVVIAHNANFDQHFICKKWPDLPKRPWVCSLKQLTFPKATASKKLNHLAVDHGISPVDAHRAMGDVIVLCRILQEISDLERQVTLALSGKSTVTANTLYEVFPSNFGENDTYKAAGFRFDREAKRWRKRMSKEDAGKLSFQVRPVAIPSIFQAPKTPKVFPVASPTKFETAAKPLASTLPPASIPQTESDDQPVDDDDDWDL